MTKELTQLYLALVAVDDRLPEETREYAKEELRKIEDEND